jgi:hypothetical protein
MKFFRPWIFIAVLVVLIPGIGFSQEDDALVENVGSGAIDWTSGIIRAVGIGAPPEKYYGRPEARPMALRAAKLDAYRNILEVIEGVRIQSSTLVKNFMMADDTISAQVNGMVRGAQVAKQEYMSDGTVEVTLEMNLKGGFAQLILPEDIKQVESIKASPSSSSSPASPKPDPKVYTGLIVDARGLDAKPAMSPRVLDENGQEVYGAAFVSREYAVQQGMSGYSKNIDAATKNQRVTANPIIVKALKTEGPGKTDLVINNSEASNLRGEPENLSFLKQCRVIIVVD